MKCYVLKSMSTHIQQAYWRSINEEFAIEENHLVFQQHRVSEYGDCQRCGHQRVHPLSPKG